MEQKRYRVMITPFAENAMREIGQYIAHDLLAPTTAVKLLKAFHKEISELNFMPERVQLTPEEPWHSYGIRRLIVKNFYVYFWIDEDNAAVRVTDIVYARREQEPVLNSMPLN